MPSDVSSWTCGQSDGRQSESYRQPKNTDRDLSAPEGRNPLREGRHFILAFIFCGLFCGLSVRVEIVDLND